MRTQLNLLLLIIFLFSCKKENDEIVNPEMFSQQINFHISEIAHPATPVKCIEITSEGYYFTSGNTLFFIGENRKNFSIIADSEILSLAYNPREKAIYFGTKSSGLGKYDGSRIEYFTQEDNDLPRNLIARVECDNDGNIWFISSAHQLGGLVKFYRNHFTIFRPENSNLEGNAIFQLKNRNGKIYVIGQNAGTGKSFYKITGSNWDRLFETDGCNPTDFAIDSQGTVYYIEDSREYCGGGLLPDMVVFTFSDNKKTIVREHDNQMNKPYILEVDKRDYLWTAKFHAEGHQLLSVFDGTEWHEAPEEFPNDFIYCIEVDEKSNIWLGTINGIYILEQQ